MTFRSTFALQCLGLPPFGSRRPARRHARWRSRASQTAARVLTPRRARARRRRRTRPAGRLRTQKPILTTFNRAPAPRPGRDALFKTKRAFRAARKPPSDLNPSRRPARKTSHRFNPWRRPGRRAPRRVNRLYRPGGGAPLQAKHTRRAEPGDGRVGGPGGRAARSHGSKPQRRRGGPTLSASPLFSPLAGAIDTAHRM
jgi:hypothetical protein